MPRLALLHLRDLGIEDIDTGVVTLAGGRRHVAVLRLEGLSLHLQTEAQQDATIAAFAKLLDGQQGPLQLLVRVVPVDLEPRLERFRRQAPPELGRLRDAHIAHQRDVAQRHALLNHEYYVVVPGPERQPRQPRQQWVEASRRALDARCRGLVADFGRYVHAERLGSKQLASLYYRFWSADYAAHRRLDATLAEWQPLVVGGRTVYAPPETLGTDRHAHVNGTVEEVLV
jgi:hypothetical protein